MENRASKIIIVPFQAGKDEKVWDEFIPFCNSATFLHTRKFLSYHGDRFVDQSLLIYLDGKLIGLFPAASNPNDATQIVSHPGITYGGLLIEPTTNVVLFIEIMKEISLYYYQKKYITLIYKCVPNYLKILPSEDDLYTLYYLNASLVRRDISCVIDLKIAKNLSSKELHKLNRKLKKAEKSEISIKEGAEYLPAFYDLLNKNLIEKYGTKPVHSYSELLNLFSLFPLNIKLVVALVNQEVMAGTILFESRTAVHTQYLSIKDEGKQIFALDYVLNYCVNAATAGQKNFFSFGVSNEKNGKYLNEGLYLSKAKHGGTGMVHDFYEIDLSKIERTHLSDRH